MLKALSMCLPKMFYFWSSQCSQDASTTDEFMPNIHLNYIKLTVFVDCELIGFYIMNKRLLWTLNLLWMEFLSLLVFDYSQNVKDWEFLLRVFNGILFRNENLEQIVNC